MKIRFQYTEYRNLPEEATIYSYKRSRNAVIFSLWCGAGLLLGVAFLLGHKVFGLLAPIVIIAISAGGFFYLCTGYQKKTRAEIERMKKIQRDAELEERKSLERYRSGKTKIDNPALRARMELFSKGYMKQENETLR